MAKISTRRLAIAAANLITEFQSTPLGSAGTVAIPSNAWGFQVAMGTALLMGGTAPTYWLVFGGGTMFATPPFSPVVALSQEMNGGSVAYVQNGGPSNSGIINWFIADDSP